MVAYPSQRLNVPIAGSAAALAALLAAATFAVVPVGLIESLVVASRLPQFLSFAAPPLGATARALLCFGAAVGIGGLTMVAMSWRYGDRSLAIGRPRAEQDGFEPAPVVRRADAHPDAPPRPPVNATRELGAPMMSVGADGAEERPLPRDLDTPLADYDPQAFVESHPPEPLPREDEPDYRVVAPAPLPRPAPLAAGERFETFDLNPPAPSAPVSAKPQSRFDREVSVHALLERLEAGVARRTTDGSLRVDGGDTRLSIAIDSLRRLATAG